MTGFGMAHLKTEGAHLHPDDPMWSVGQHDDAAYIKQLCGYIQDNNLDMIKEFQSCSRRGLLRQAIETGPIQAFGIGGKA